MGRYRSSAALVLLCWMIMGACATRSILGTTTTSSQIVTNKLVNVSTNSNPAIAGQYVSLGKTYCVGVQQIAIPGTDYFFYMERPTASHPDKKSYNAGYLNVVTGNFTNVWTNSSLENCGHSYLKNGTIMVLAGHKPQSVYPEGRKGIRVLDLKATPMPMLRNIGNLQYGHWLATATRLPNGMITVMSDSPVGTEVGPTASSKYKNPMYELWDPANPTNTTVFQMHSAFVTNTKYFYYPFNFILPTGDMLVWANVYGEIIDPLTGVTKAYLPNWSSISNTMYTQYPFSGTGFMLPLTPANNYTPEIMVCGGQWSYGWINTTAVNLCMRLKITINSNGTYTFGKWQAETMPGPRVSGTSVLLPNGKVILINGAQAGLLGDAADGGVAMLNNPNFWPYLYDPSAAAGNRFTVLARSQIARLLHSTAALTVYGGIVVAGGDRSDKFWSNVNYSKSPTGFPEYRVETFNPPFVYDTANRPTIMDYPSVFNFGQTYTLTYAVDNATATVTSVVLVAPPSDTHTFNMHQRVVGLDIIGTVADDHLSSLDYGTSIVVRGPPNANITPPGPYMLFMVCGNTYGEGQWVYVSDSS